MVATCQTRNLLECGLTECLSAALLIANCAYFFLAQHHNDGAYTLQLIFGESVSK